jgi:O-antigen/teichoic acid export membrane protein
MRGISGAVIALPATLLGFLYLSVDERHLFAFLILCSMFNAALVVEYWLQAYVANRYVSQVRLLTLFVFSAARIFAICEGASLSVFVYLAGLEVICAGLLYIWVYNQLGGGITNLHYSWVEAKRLLKDSRWLILSGIAAIIYLKVDQVMLGLMVGDREVGIYAAAARISEVWYFVPAAIAASFFPRLIDLRSVDLQAYSIDLQKLNDFLLYSALVVVAIVSYCATWLLPLLFGAAYESAVPVLVVHIWAGLFVFMRTLLSKWFIAENLLKLSMASQVLGALVNILLNLKLIPLYGAVGAAYATVISLAVAGYVVLFLHPKLWPMALVVTRSFLLPLRLLRKGRGLYKV